ncbi:hypothetical protein D3C87_1333300 [compost metagenome]
MFSFLPNLIVKESWNCFRIQYALTGVVAVYAFFAIEGFSTLLKGAIPKRIFLFLVPFAALISIVVAGQNVRDVLVYSQLKEYNWLNERLSVVKSGRFERICVVPHDSWDALVERPRFDEVGIPALKVSWVRPFIVAVILREHGVDPTRYSVDFVEPAEQAPTGNGILVIDASEIARRKQ